MEMDGPDHLHHHHNHHHDRRRKEREQQEEDEDDEEVKMEKFYAILRSFKEARIRHRSMMIDLQRNNNNNDDNNDNDNEGCKRRKVNVEGTGKGEEPRQTSWVPSFQWEDFSHGDLIDIKNKEEKKGVDGSKCDTSDDGGGLDLKLTL